MLIILAREPTLPEADLCPRLASRLIIMSLIRAGSIDFHYFI